MVKEIILQIFMYMVMGIQLGNALISDYTYYDMDAAEQISDMEEADIYEEAEAHWHNEFYYEDIEMLADISTYDESGEYHISTVNQLAGLVKLVNEGRTFEDCSIYLENDLDLAGYSWVPIGWYYPADNNRMWQDFPFMGKFYGNGHVIYNMSIIEPEHSDLGMFGRALTGFAVCDLGLINCNIEGKYYVGGFVGDIVSNSGEYDIQNCFITGCVKGKLDAGAILGSAAGVKLKNCYALMTEDSTQVLAANLRGEHSEQINCHINDKEAKLEIEK